MMNLGRTTELQDEKSMHEEKEVTRESSTPLEVISSELLSIRSTNVIVQVEVNRINSYKYEFRSIHRTLN